MRSFDQISEQLKSTTHTWTVTGCAGFIGSNLVEYLLSHNQKVIGLDNFSTGHFENLNEVKANLPLEKWEKFTFIQGDICDLDTCHGAVKGADFVLHQAALGSVPRSIKDPITTNKANIDGFLNMLVAARDASVKCFVYAASSSTYGDHPALPKIEENIGKPLSPYAVTKYVNELYADVFAKAYGFRSVGLRYFNVFGKRQDPEGAYAAVIPKWVSAMIKGEEVCINGDGETSRDFCYVQNVIEANILAAFASSEGQNNVYNVAVGDRTSLNQLFKSIQELLREKNVVYTASPIYQEFRQGDVRHSQASIEKATQLLGYMPQFKLRDGLALSMDWYIKKLSDK